MSRPVPRLFLLGLAGALLGAGCGARSSSNTSSEPGVVLEQGLTSVQQIFDRIENHDMVIQVDQTEFYPDDTDVTTRFTFWPNGDATYTSLAVHAYHVSGNHYECAPEEPGNPCYYMPVALGDVDLSALSPFLAPRTPTQATNDDGSPSSTAAGTLTARGSKYVFEDQAQQEDDRVEFKLDNARRLVEVRAHNHFGHLVVSTISYPGTVANPTAPAGAKDYAEFTGKVATATLQSGIDVMARLLGDVGVIADVTAKVFDEAMMGTFVEVERSYDAQGVGFANDGTTIELVSSDGIGHCYRVTITQAGASAITSDTNGAPSDLGAVTCSTTITHVGEDL